MTGRLLLAVGLLLTTVLAMAWGSGAHARATTFNPFFGPPDFYRLDPTTSGAYSDTHAQFNILPPSANFSPHFGGLITFGDSDIYVADSVGIPGTGAYVGRLQSTALLGLANEGCNTQLDMTFELVEANTETSALQMTPNVTLTSAITSSQAPFTYTSAGDPIGPPSGASLGGQTRAEIEIDSEQILVTNINQTTNTYSGLIRGWNGTTPAAHNAGDQIRKVNVIFPAGPPGNLPANLAEDDGDFDNNGTAELPQFAGNGVADGADSLPGFVRDSLDPDVHAANGGYVQARARYEGVASVNTLIVILQFVVMDPGALTVFPNLQWASSAWGYSSVTFLQDPLAPPSNNAISDFCNFTSNTFLLGVPHDNACTGALPPPSCTGAGAGFTLRFAADGGCPGTTTPNECGTACAPSCAPPCDPGACYRQKNTITPQTVRFYEYAVSQRDYDNDGIENGLDPCPSAPNGGWDPRANNSLSGGDTDADGLPDACDPAPASFNNDQDGDGWPNRIDNCPTVANAAPGGGGGTTPNTFQFDRDVPPGQNVPDGGPPSDDIGPACDIATQSCTTDGKPIAPAACSTLTPTGANGHYHATPAAQTICIGGVNTECSFTADDDGDGVVNAIDTCRAGANPPYVFGGAGSPPTWTAGANTTLVGAHAAGALNLTVASSAGFIQGNPIVIASPTETLRYIASIPDATHLTITSGLSSGHAGGATVRMVSYAQSMRDMTNDGFVDISDVQKLTGVFGTRGGDPTAPAGYQGRYDTNYDTFVDITDVQSLTGMFGAACGPP